MTVKQICRHFAVHRLVVHNNNIRSVGFLVGYDNAMKLIEWFQRVALIWRRLRKRTLGKKRWSTIWTSKMVLVHPSPYMGVQAPFSTIRFGNVQQKGSTKERKNNLGRVDKARTRRTGDDGRDADKAFQFHTSLLKHSRQLSQKLLKFDRAATWLLS